MHKNNNFIYSAILLLFTVMSISVFAQFEPQKGMFKGELKVRRNGLELGGSFMSQGFSQVPYNMNAVDYIKDNNCSFFFIDNFKVIFGFWMLLGEPVCEYKFYWEYDKNYLFWHTYKGKTYHFKISDFEKYPDLMKQFKYITPLPDIKIEVYLNFFTNGIIYPIANCKHLMNIDLASPAFVKENFSLPGSTDWDIMYTDMSIRETPYIGGKKMDRTYWISKEDGYNQNMDKKVFAKNMQKLFSNISKIEIYGAFRENYFGMGNYVAGSNNFASSPKLISLKWNWAGLKYIFDDYCNREEKATLAKTQSKTPTTTTKTDDFWNTTTPTTSKTAAEEDFWNSTSVPSEIWTGKLDQAEQLYTQKKWKEARAFYQEVAKNNPNLNYAINKVKFIDKLLAYKPKIEADYIAVRSKNSPNLYGFVNKEGELVINYQFIEAFNFNENLARVRVKTQNGKYNWGYIDGTSNFVIPAIYSNATDFKNAQAEVDLLKKIVGRTSYFDTGFIDPSGKWISPPKEKTYTEPQPITIYWTTGKKKR